MRTATLLVLTLVAVVTARADFSYTSTRKSAQAPSAGAAPQNTKHYLKGQKIKMEMGDSSTIMDFDAQTLTSINKARKTYSVTKFSELGQVIGKTGADAQVDVKETGQHKNINGYDANEIVMTISMDGPSTGQTPMKVTVEMDTWLSSAVPGAEEYLSFYRKNAGHFPWASMGGGGNPSMQKAMAEMQKKMATAGGVPVLQVMKMKSGGSEAQTAQVQAGMAQARARLEEMKKQGGQQAAMAEQMLARMGAAGGAGSLFETTMESSDFSASSIPDSVFAIPEGYQIVEKK